MNISLENMVESVKIIVTISILFVWLVRYENIRKEFIDYKFPRWFRDLIGILKISFVIMLHSGSNEIVLIGSGGISILMLGAVITHIRMKSKFRQYIASVAMLSISLFILYFTLS